MKYTEGDYEAVHTSPVWRSRANFIFAAHLGVKDGRNEWEQLWGEKTAQGRCVLCCIPFFTYDVALGDEVETDSESMLKTVVKRSGQVTFRLWLDGQSPDERQITAVEIEKMGALLEWSSDNLLALSVPEGNAVRIAAYLHKQEQDGRLQYETGQSLKN